MDLNIKNNKDLMRKSPEKIKNNDMKTEMQNKISDILGKDSYSQSPRKQLSKTRIHISSKQDDSIENEQYG